MPTLLEEMLDGFYQNPLNPHEAVLLSGDGDPIAGVTLHEMSAVSWGPRHLHLEEIRAMRKGGGRELMEILVHRADELCATMAGTVKPLPAAAYGLKKMPIRKLMAWYKSFGFVKDRGFGNHIIRHPDPKKCG